jgi:Cof subfamily protein (haloacid dehalogenase superfamily)
VPDPEIRPTNPEPATVPLHVFDPQPDIRLIAADMDGTLLNDEHELHDHFWPLIHHLHERGIRFSPASGRQYYRLREQFSAVADELIFIAENGTYVVHQDAEISSDCLSTADAHSMIIAARGAIEAGADAGVVLCGKRSAYIERVDPAFVREAAQYYARLELVDDLLAVQDDILKVSVFDYGAVESTTLPAFAEHHISHLVTVSGAHWVDVISKTASKGRAVRRIQEMYGITPAQTMVFGDFLNDLDMMDTADYSFAMANAHPLLKERARYLAPGNTDNGVVRVIAAAVGAVFDEPPAAVAGGGPTEGPLDP